jgi:hypothetical protein
MEKEDNMEERTMFKTPVEYMISQDIKNPDIYLDKLIRDYSDDPTMQEKLETIKSLEHNEKVAWLLGLATKEQDEERAKMEPVTGCIIVVITIVVAVVVGYIVVEGIRQAIIEYQERQKEVEKCTNKEKKP